MTQTKTIDTSKRSNNIEASITLQISSLAQQMKKEGKNVIAFSAGEPDFDTPENIKAAGINAIQEGKNKYTPASGIIELKEAIVSKLQKDQNIQYTTDQIIVSSGAKHSVYNALAALVDPGDEVIIPTPYWVSYPQQVSLTEGTCKYIETTDQTHFKMNANQLKESITEKSKVLILNTPSNPTGMIYSEAELKNIADVILEHNLYVISDEIYEKLIYGDNTHISIASLSDEIKERTILINGVSKAYSMTGWRIGYTASSEPIAKAMNKMQSHMTSNPTAAAQWASVEAISGTQDPVETMKVDFAKRRTLMINKLNNTPGIQCIEPQGAFYSFPNISGCFGKKTPSGNSITDSVSFCKYLLQEAEVACVPGAGFGADSYIRLSYATSETLIEEGLTRIQNWVNQLT